MPFGEAYQSRATELASSLLFTGGDDRWNALLLSDATMPVRSLSLRLLLIAFVSVFEFVSLSTDVRAAELACGCHAGVCVCVRRFESNGWKGFESPSFRIHYVGASTTAEPLALACERKRKSLRERWLDDRTTAGWTPKCDVFLYPTANEFQRLTRRPAAMRGFADLEIGEGRVWTRQLHLRADDAKQLDKLVTHELTHVVLADYFADHQIPRWADEGIAILSEPDARQSELRRWLKQEATLGRVFSLQQLASQRQLPPDQRLGDLFYAQSSSFVEFLLIERKLSEPQLLRFVSEVESRGLSATLARWFPEIGSNAWETEWRQWMTSTRAGVQLADDRSEKKSSNAPAD